LVWNRFAPSANWFRHHTGEYAADPNRLNLFSKLNFTSGSKVELTAEATGATTEATYVVDGDKLKISAAGQTRSSRLKGMVPLTAET
jgi:endonuclease YncB( thermonuclease family)